MLTFLIILFILASLFSLNTTNEALLHLKKYRSTQQIDSMNKFFFYKYLHDKIFNTNDFKSLFFSINCAKGIAYVWFSTCTFVFTYHWFGAVTYAFGLGDFNGIIIVILITILTLTIGEFIPQQFAIYNSNKALKFFSPIASIFLTLFLPISFLLIKLSRTPKQIINNQDEQPTKEMKEKIVEMLQETHTSDKFTATDKKIIESIVTFKDRIVREIMIPRIDLTALPANTTIQDAAKTFQEEGFSRIPVYREDIDNIIGMLMHKDILAIYTNKNQETNINIEKLVKNVIFTPETKKISVLLQEFRQKQMHLAIVVDEYGGTAGIVTIEDILEEIVGEIADEYDVEEELFTPLPNGGWIVDAKMSIIDAEEEFNIKIPQIGDYDTIGGYIFHKAGSIPSRGFTIHQDQFKLEVLTSNDRCIEKVKILPIPDFPQPLTKF